MVYYIEKVGGDSVQDDNKQYTIKWIKGYPYIYFWVYMPTESISIRSTTAADNMKKYGTKREAWQKASSYYKWYSMGRADKVGSLSNSEIDIYIETKLEKAIKRLKNKCSEELPKDQVDKVIQSWQQAKEIILENKERIKKETTM